MATDVDTGVSLPDIFARWQGRSAVAIVDLDVLASNVGVLRDLIGPDVRLMPMVKANAYGHGAVPVARTVLAAGADALGVATVDEGAQLRMAGIDAPILVFGAIGAAERGRAIGNDLELVIADAGFARGLAAEVRASLRKEPLPVHLKIDTGLHRFGAEPADAVEIAKTIAASPELQLAGVMTHQASADAPDPAAVRVQAAEFERALAALRDAGIDLPALHMANSATTIRFPEYRCNQVRTGIATYGLDPDPALPVPAGMRPILTIHARLARVFHIQPGDTVGYGGTYSPSRSERAGLVTLGYGDGYRRSLSNAGWMSVRGRRADVIGRVSMDQSVIRLPDDLDVEAGEPVVVVGNGTGETAGAPTLNELAGLAGTISYELATGLTARLPRLYLRDRRVVAVADLSGLREFS